MAWNLEREINQHLDEIEALADERHSTYRELAYELVKDGIPTLFPRGAQEEEFYEKAYEAMVVTYPARLTPESRQRLFDLLWERHEAHQNDEEYVTSGEVVLDPSEAENLARLEFLTRDGRWVSYRDILAAILDDQQ